MSNATPEQASASIDSLYDSCGSLDRCAWVMLKDAYRALRSYIPRDSGLMLEIEELMSRKDARE